MNLIDDIMEKMTKEMRQTRSLFSKDFEAFDLSPYFKNGKGTGFSIKIVQNSHNKPKISIKTFGNMDKNKLEKQIQKQLGTIKSNAQTNTEKKGFLQRIGISEDGRPQQRKKLPAPNITEEPKTEIKKLDSKVIVNMDMPGIKSEKDIEIKDLESSLEVKAISGDKAYFKILTKPGYFSLVKKKFTKGKLHLEFS